MRGRSTPTYDRIGRMTERVLDVRTDSGSYYGKTTYTYEKHNQNDTLRVSRTETTVGTTAAGATVRNVQQYTYDKCGNITEIRDAGGTVQYRYAYDHLGQLVREDNRPLGVTLVYTYDGRGNLLGRKEYAFTTGTVSGNPRKNRENTYAATGWRDLFMGDDGKSVTYDAIGNPRLFRILVFPISGAMLTYDRTCDSYMGIVNEVLTILSAILGILRARREEKRCTAEAPASRAT